MAGGESWDGSFGTCSPSGEGYHFDKLHVEPVYDAFICPLTKQLMKEPVTIENGMTFEREAIEKWFGECRGKILVCPLTLKELRTTDLNPNLSLMQAIREWEGRNEAAQFEMAQMSLSVECEEDEVLQALNYVQHLSQKGRPSNLIIRHAFPKIVNVLKSGSRVVRCKALQTLRVLSERDDDSKEMMAEGDIVRTIVKFLSHELSKERGEAISLLYELSKSEVLCEKVGSVNGAILILIGMASSKSERVVIIEKAEKTLVNLEICENNILQMADNGRLNPLLMQLLNGEPETRLMMAKHLGDLVLSNEVKENVTDLVGPSLVRIIQNSGGGGDTQSREAALKALYQISSSDASSRLLVDSGILPALIGHLFSVAPDQLPTRLKEVCAAILSNIVSSSAADRLVSVPVMGGSHTLLSEPVVHNLLHLISNTSPAIEGKLLQVLVGLTAASSSLLQVAAAIRGSGAATSLVQFIEAPQPELRLAAMKLLRNIAPHLGPELADALRGSSGQLGTLVRLISENSAVSDEQAAAAGLLSDLPVLDLGLTRQMLDEGVFRLAVSRILAARQGGTKASRFVTPYLEGLVSVLSRVTFALREEPEAVGFAQEHDLAAIFTDLLNLNGLDVVQTLSAAALENLSRESRNLTMLPEVPPPTGVCGRLFGCCRSDPAITGLCRVHTGICSARETFCLLEGRGVGDLVALLDHTNEKVLEASLGALLTLLEDGVDIEQGVQVLCEAEAVKAVLDVLLERRAEGLRRKAVWAVERMLRTTEIAYQVSTDPNVSATLVEAFQHGDYETRQIAECALKHIDRLPTFSEIFSNTL